VGNVGAADRLDLTAIGPAVNLRVTLARRAVIAVHLTRMSTNRLAARGFTGYVYVALENTGADSGPLTIEPGQRYRVISNAPSRIDTMDTTVADATQKVRVLTRLLQSVLDEKTITSLKQSVDEFQEIMALLVANNERLHSLIINAKRDSRDISLLLDEKTIGSLKRLVDELQGVMATLAANSERLRSVIVNAERDSRDVGPLLNTSNITLRELREVLPRFYQAIGNLDGLTHSLNGVANKITRDPSTIVRGTATPPGPGER